MNEKYFVEYSVNQKQFHIDKINIRLVKNLNNCSKAISTDYQVLAICDTMDAALEEAKRLENEYKLEVRTV